MDSISLICPECKHPLKFPANRAGTEGECVYCGADLQIPRTPANNNSNSDDEESGGAYGLVDVVEEKKQLPVEKKKEKKAGLDPTLRKKKRLQDGDKWNVVRGGLTVMSTAAAAWALIFGLQMLIVLFGCTLESDYNPARVKILLAINKAEHLEAETKLGLNRNRFALALLYGTDYLAAFQTVQVLLSLISIFPIVLFILGYFACSRSPNRFGMHEQVKAMIILAFVNTFILLLFKILPLAGLMPYTPLPYFVPELATLSANEERFLPLQVVWGRVPFLDMFLTILFICSKFAECTLGGIFIHTMGFTIKNEELREAGNGLVQLAMRTAYFYIVFHLFSLCGCSNMLVNTLRVVYLFAVGCQFWFIIRYMLVLNQAVATLNKKMEDMTEDELRWKDDDDPIEDDDDEEEDDDDEDAPKKKRKPKPEANDENGDGKKKKKRKRDEEDDDDDDEEEDRPRKKKKR